MDALFHTYFQEKGDPHGIKRNGKKLLFQVEGDYQTKILNELYMTVRYSNNSEQREAAEGLMAKLRVLSNAECMDLVKDIQKNYRLPYPARTIGEKIAEARQQSGAEKLKGHDIMALERFDPEVRHMIILMYCLTIPLLATKAIRCACSLQMPAIRNF